MPETTSNIPLYEAEHEVVLLFINRGDTNDGTTFPEDAISWTNKLYPYVDIDSADESKVGNRKTFKDPEGKGPSFILVPYNKSVKLFKKSLKKLDSMNALKSKGGFSVCQENIPPHLSQTFSEWIKDTTIKVSIHEGLKKEDIEDDTSDEEEENSENEETSEEEDSEEEGDSDEEAMETETPDGEESTPDEEESTPDEEESTPSDEQDEDQESEDEDGEEGDQSDEEDENQENEAEEGENSDEDGNEQSSDVSPPIPSKCLELHEMIKSGKCIVVNLERLAELGIVMTLPTSSPSTQPKEVHVPDAEGTDDEDEAGEESQEEDVTEEEEKDWKSTNLRDYTRKRDNGDWKEFFDTMVKDRRFKNLSAKLEKEKGEICPKLRDLYRPFDLCPLDELKAIVIGTEPYNERGLADGLAYSHTARDDHSTTYAVSEIYNALVQDGFAVKNRHSGDMSKWAKRGVLMINTTLTTMRGKPKAHGGEEKIWGFFIDALFKYINEKKDHVAVIAWGSDAKNYANAFDTKKHKVLYAPHPSASLYGNKDNSAFMNQKPFSKANAFLKKKGVGEIDWSLK